VLTCQECGCVSESGKGWFAYIVEDPDASEGPVVCMYCPPCAEAELEARPRSAAYLCTFT
jgi:hypothetical protein